MRAGGVWRRLTEGVPARALAVLAALAALLTCASVSAQDTLDAPPPMRDVVFAHDSGLVRNDGTAPGVVIAFRVQVADASTLTLYGAVEGLPLTAAPRLAPPARRPGLPVVTS